MVANGSWNGITFCQRTIFQAWCINARYILQNVFLCTRIPYQSFPWCYAMYDWKWNDSIFVEGAFGVTQFSHIFHREPCWWVYDACFLQSKGSKLTVASSLNLLLHTNHSTASTRPLLILQKQSWQQPTLLRLK